MSKALYRKYRSTDLNEIVGQKHITSTLQKAIVSGRISHAYLFVGPRGVGKTSVARILAYNIIDLGYELDKDHIDIIEIDAASNRGIEDIKELREKLYVAPTLAKYKVYIIDEVHMLTSYAFNALLKTLEEPPDHVIFILATTEAHKLPLTIISRTQRFTFKPLNVSDISKHLNFIAEKENININEQAIQVIAEHGDGSLRDSISLLDQLTNFKQDNQEISLSDVHELLGIPPNNLIKELTDILFSDNKIANYSVQALLNVLKQLYDSGYHAPIISKYLSKYIRKLIINDDLSNLELKLILLKELINVQSSPLPDNFLEIVLLDIYRHKNPVVVTNNKLPNHKLNQSKRINNNSVSTIQAKKIIKNSDDKLCENLENNTFNLRDSKIKASTNKIESKEMIQNSNLHFDNIWKELLIALKVKYNTIYGIIRLAEPSLSDGMTISLLFKYPFHQKTINDVKNKKIIIDIIKKISGTDYHIECLLMAKNPIKSSKSINNFDINVEVNAKSVETINSIFGGGEVINYL